MLCKERKKESEVAQSCRTLCDPMDCSLPGFSIHGIFQEGKNTGVGCHFLLQEIFPTQGLNPSLLHCRQTLYCLRHQESPLAGWYKPLTGFPLKPYEVTAELQSRAPHLLHTGHVMHSQKHTVELVKYSRKHVH